MKSPHLQSALRELHVLARSSRLWITFGAVVLLFTLTGPYDTAERLAFLPRLAFWLLLHAGAWLIALTFAVAADVALRARLDTMFLRMMVGTLLASLPIGLVILLCEWSWFADPITLDGYFGSLLTTIPLSAIFCVVSYLALSATKEMAVVPADGSPDATAMPSPGIPLLDRISAGVRGPLQHISVEDHYCRVRTSRGNELILMRFSDALKETGTADGLQVHRSHWVARDFVEGFRSDNGRLSLALKDGTEVPVSRSRTELVRGQFDKYKNPDLPARGRESGNISLN